MDLAHVVTVYHGIRLQRCGSRIAPTLVSFVFFTLPPTTGEQEQEAKNERR
jgi:hypothetical protein